MPLQALLHKPHVRDGAWDLCVSIAAAVPEMAYQIINVDNWYLTTSSDTLLFNTLLSVSQYPPLL